MLKELWLFNENDGKSGSFNFTDHINDEEHEQTLGIEGDPANSAQESVMVKNCNADECS